MTVTPVVFRDAEAATIDYLTPLMGEVSVVGRVPDPRPGRFIRVERIGGVRQTRVTDGANIVVEGWAGTDLDAAVLLNTARSYLFDADGPYLFGVTEYGGPARLPDPYSNMSRYTASLTIRIRPIQ